MYLRLRCVLPKGTLTRGTEVVILLLFLQVAVNEVDSFPGKVDALDHELGHTDFSSECGGKLGTQMGVISYKPFITYRGFERCVWSIQTPNAIRYTFYLYNMGSRDGNDRLLITALQPSQNQSQQVQHYVIPTQNTNDLPYEVEVEGSTILVSFFTNYITHYRGVSLAYYSNRSEFPVPPSPSPLSTHHVISVSRGAERGVIRYPPSGNYDNNELASLIFTPNITSGTTLPLLELQYTSLGLENISCWDFINVYYFSGTGFSYIGKICGGDRQVTLQNYDMILLVFQSDSSGVSSGFQVTYQLA